MTDTVQAHWDGIYGARDFTEVSWYEPVPRLGLALIEASGISKDDSILDVGGGSSMLVDYLLKQGFGDISILDVSANAFAQSRTRLGVLAEDVNWLVADITGFRPDRQYRLWHDRAVMHFLTDNARLDRYVDVLKQALAPGGSLVLSTFGPDGPLRCSGLKIRRYNVESLVELLGRDFELQRHELDNHVTPAGAAQQFLYTSWIRKG